MSATHVYHSAVYGLAPQGRYLLPAAWPILLLLALGWERLGHASGCRRLGAMTPVILMAWLQASAIRAEWASLHVEQPDRQVRGWALAYGAPLPVVKGNCPDSSRGAGPAGIVWCNGACRISPGAAITWPGEAPGNGAMTLVFDLYQAPQPGAMGTLVVEEEGRPTSRRSFRLAPIEPSGVVRYRLDLDPSPFPAGASLRCTLWPAAGFGPGWLYRVQDRE